MSESTEQSVSSRENSNFYEMKSSEEDENSVRYFKGRTMFFFSMSKSEYKEFINKMGSHTKWEFDIVYNNFKKSAENALAPLETNNINSAYTTDKRIGLINMKNDTVYFDRSKDDYFVGQVLFDGKDSVLITEGLYKTNMLEDLITDFFHIKTDFTISYVPEMSDTFRYHSPDTTLVHNKDSV